MPSRAGESTSPSCGVHWRGILRSASACRSALVPVPSGKGDLPFAFDISMGVKKGNDALLKRLEKVLDQRQAEITKILRDYGVPLLERKVTAKR